MLNGRVLAEVNNSFRTEIVRWVTESMRPFSIVKDRGFQSLMKTGRPGYWIPSPSTVAQDIKSIYMRTRTRIGHLLCEYDGRLSFTTDAWTSPNHRVFVAICVHFILRGEPVSMILDLVEVPKVRTVVYGAHLRVANC